jgi:hypothetical protein
VKPLAAFGGTSAPREKLLKLPLKSQSLAAGGKPAGAEYPERRFLFFPADKRPGKRHPRHVV